MDLQNSLNSRPRSAKVLGKIGTQSVETVWNPLRWLRRIIPRRVAGGIGERSSRSICSLLRTSERSYALATVLLNVTLLNSRNHSCKAGTGIYLYILAFLQLNDFYSSFLELECKHRARLCGSMRRATLATVASGAARAPTARRGRARQPPPRVGRCALQDLQRPLLPSLRLWPSSEDKCAWVFDLRTQLTPRYIYFFFSCFTQ
ncbi:hypothetical protein GQ54DRAFT_184594 [Martensiomyces pterosporus]|nr:hypothetical protein GQ54DRAFT_184594 [Martensiomyces pterosporus]